MHEIYEKYGAFSEQLVSVTLEGKSGLSEIKRIMEYYRNTKDTSIGGINIREVTDYKDTEKTGLPKSDVLKFSLENGADFIMRPSGTEPKIKYYILAESDTYLMITSV